MRRIFLLVFLAGCSRKTEGPPPAPVVPAAASSAPASSSCGPTCTKFDTAEAAFEWVLSFEPSILAIGEAHAQKGTEDIASSTKRFTENLLPIVAPKSSDLVVELWAPDPKCM